MEGSKGCTPYWHKSCDTQEMDRAAMNEVPGLIRVMEDACQRTLYDSIGITDDKPTAFDAISIKPRDGQLRSDGKGVQRAADNANDSKTSGNKDSSFHTGKDSGAVGVTGTGTGASTTNSGGGNITSRKRPRLNPQAHEAGQHTWTDLLQHAGMIALQMTEQEHGYVLNLATTMLLGYLLPLSTGNHSQLLQHVSSANGKQQKQSDFVPSSTPASTSPSTQCPINNSREYVLAMSLIERMECGCQSYTSTEVRESEVFGDSDLDLCFHRFIHRGLAQLLDRRPIGARSPDILHLIAMAIHPQPSEKYVRKTVKKLADMKPKPKAWIESQRYWTCQIPHYFHIKYAQRMELVNLVVNHLILPENDGKDHAVVETPLDAAIIHLRASLHSFYYCAMSACDAHIAQCAIVSCTIQLSKDAMVREEWDLLLNRMMDDTGGYDHCRCHRHRRQNGTSCLDTPAYKDSVSWMTQTRSTFCPHAARGHLLTRFLNRYSEARHYASIPFLHRCLSTLTDAVEWQVHRWTKQASEAADEDKTNEETKDDATADGKENADDASKEEEVSKDSTCMFASLLFAAKNLFYFLVTSKIDAETDAEGQPEEESQYKDMLVSCAIQLLHHEDRTIVREASQLLSIAISYGSADMVSDYDSAIVASIRIAVSQLMGIKEKDHNKPKQPEQKQQQVLPATQNLCMLVSQKSPAFARTLIKLLLEQAKQVQSDSPNDQSKREILFAFAAGIATACPQVAKEQASSFLEDRADLTSSASFHLAAALLATRMAHFFVTADPLSSAITKKLTQDPWKLYLLGRHALVTGNPSNASEFYGILLKTHCETEDNYMWLAALKSMADAEAMVTSRGCLGFPIAIQKLNLAMMHLQSISGRDDHGHRFKLQTDLFRLRADFLQLGVGLRQLLAEMRLTGSLPKKFTRPRLHLANLIRSFRLLADRYHELYKEHGLFMCQQSRSSLRTCIAVCLFLARCIERSFPDALDNSSKMASMKPNDEMGILPLSDESHSITKLMMRLHTLVFADMDVSIEPIVRAAAMLEVLECIAKSPLPIPRGVITVGCLPTIAVQLAGDPDTVDVVSTEESVDGVPMIEVVAGLPFKIIASGRFPPRLFRGSQVEFSTVLVEYKLEQQQQPAEESNNNTNNTGSGGNNSTTNTDTNEEDKASNAATEDSTPAEEDDADADAANTKCAAAISSDGNFIIPIRCEGCSEEGIHTFQATVGCRDIRGDEWKLRLDSSSCSTVLIRITRAGR